MMRPRLRSRTSCLTCKQRRKACDEAKPVCASCFRLGIRCIYADYQRAASRPRGAIVLGTQELNQASNIEKPLTHVRLRNAEEALAIWSAPFASMVFFSPSCTITAEDLGEIWQVMWSEDIVRDSVIACFSHIKGLSGRLSNMDRAAYGRALQQIYVESHKPAPTSRESFTLLCALMFIGIIAVCHRPPTNVPPLPRLELISAQAGGNVSEGLDQLSHFRATCIFLSRAKRFEGWSGVPVQSCILIVEALTFNFCGSAMFTDDLESAQRLWEEADPIGILERLNPPRQHRTERSPLLCGQYMIFEMMFEVIVLHRKSNDFCNQMQKISMMEEVVRRKLMTLEHDLKPIQRQQDAEATHQAIFDVFSITHNAVLIGILALKEHSLAQRCEIDQLAIQNIDRFLGMPLIRMAHGIITWSLQILACAVRHETPFQRLLGHWSDFRLLLDSGHRERTERLFKEVERLRTTSSKPDSSSSIPEGHMGTKWVELVNHNATVEEESCCPLSNHQRHGSENAHHSVQVQPNLFSVPKYGNTLSESGLSIGFSLLRKRRGVLS